jgi:hypothetical protein
MTKILNTLHIIMRDAIVGNLEIQFLLRVKREINFIGTVKREINLLIVKREILCIYYN